MPRASPSLLCVLLLLLLVPQPHAVSCVPGDGGSAFNKKGTREGIIHPVPPKVPEGFS